MKPNVDLTLNRMFRDNNLSLKEIVTQIRHFPWSDNRFSLIRINTEDELDMNHQRKSVIALGDKKMRAEIKELRNMDSGNYCDCCGAKLDTKPWDKPIGLCHRCEQYEYDEWHDKCPWRDSNNRRHIDILRGTNILV